MSATQHNIWCADDEHYQYEHFTDFNEWLDSEEGDDLRLELGVEGLSQPSKALFASDREAYDQAFVQFRNERRHEALNETHFVEQFGSDHWFQRSLAHLTQLVDLIEKDMVVPFIGAGISVSSGFPTWEDHLREQGRTANIGSDHIEDLLSNGQYEAVLEEIEASRGHEVFIQEIQDVFSRTGSIPDVIWRITELFSDTLITTNYDHILEQAYDTGEKNHVQIINGVNALDNVLEKGDLYKIKIIKLHGDIRKPVHCILSKKQYDDAYGDELDLAHPIPMLLSKFYKNKSLLFLGCSLHNDRTLEVFKKTRMKIGEEAELPQHFSIEQAPEDPEKLAARNAHLAQLGITSIWFEQGQYEYIENILRLAKSELSYRGVIPERQEKPEPETDNIKVVNLDLDLDHFLRDFVELMPLMHWLHQTIPQAETNKYLNAMQRVFCAGSLFTEQLDENLKAGLDHILRSLSNNPSFDGYTSEKLSIAFNHFQHHLNSKKLRNYSGDELKWNVHELLSIPQNQFADVVAQDKEDLDHYAIRLIIVLLRYGKKQKSSPKKYCQLPDVISQEFGDYLKWVMSSRLGITLPDRLEDYANDGIKDLCKVAWDNFDQPPKLNFIEKVRVALRYSRNTIQTRFWHE